MSTFSRIKISQMTQVSASSLAPTDYFPLLVPIGPSKFENRKVLLSDLNAYIASSSLSSSATMFSGSITASNVKVINDLVVGGNVYIGGTTTTIDSTVVDIKDRVIHVNHSTGSNDPVPTLISGISVHRGASASIDRDHSGIFWDESSQLWKFAFNTNGNDSTISSLTGIQSSIISGSNVYISGSLKVIGEAIISGSLTVSSSATFHNIGNAIFEGPTTASNVIVTGNFTASSEYVSNNLFVSGNVFLGGPGSHSFELQSDTGPANLGPILTFRNAAGAIKGQIGHYNADLGRLIIAGGDHANESLVSMQFGTDQVKLQTLGAGYGFHLTQNGLTFQNGTPLYTTGPITGSIISASFFIGDGSQLTGIPTSSFSGSGVKFSTLVGDGSSSIFTIPHGLGTADCVISLRRISDGEIVYTNTNADSTNIVLNFNQIPTLNQFKLIVIA